MLGFRVATALSKVFPISVKESNGTITISGIPHEEMANNITRVWRTSRVAGNLIATRTMSPFTFTVASFFAIELKYIVDKMIADTESGVTAKRKLKQISEQLTKNTWLKSVYDHAVQNKLDLSQLKQIIPELQPKKHQWDWLNYYNRVLPTLNLRGSLLAASPGGGKTLCAIYTALGLRVKKVVIVAPKKAIYNVWGKTLKNSFVEEQKYWICADGGIPDNDTKWFVFHYETLPKALEMINKFTGSDTMLILDESHNFNDIKSQRTQAWLKLCKMTHSENIVPVSGTALKALGTEMIPLLKAIDPLFTSEAELSFSKIFGKNVAKANDILAHRLGLISFQVPKSEFMKDKPSEHDVLIKIPNGDEYTLPAIREKMKTFIKERITFYKDNKSRFYKDYELGIKYYTDKFGKSDKEFKKYNEYATILNKKRYQLSDLPVYSVFCNTFEKTKIIPCIPKEHKQKFNDAKSVYKYVDLKIRGECLGRILGKERIRCNVDISKHVDYKSIIDNSIKKTLIFTSFVDVVGSATEKVTSSGFNALQIYASTNKDLPKIMDMFKKDDTLNPLIATFQSLSEAVPVTDANTIIMLNVPFRFHEYNQAVSRAHRIGQDTEVHIYRCYLDTGSEPNISTRSGDIMDWSKKQVDELMGIDRYGSSISIESVISYMKLEDPDLLEPLL